MNASEKNLPGWLVKSEAVQALLKKERQSALEARKVLRTKLDRNLQEREKVIPGLMKRFESAKEKMREVEVARIKAFNDAAKARLDLSDADSRLLREQQALEDQLQQTCDPIISEAIENFRGVIDTTRSHDKLKQDIFAGEKNWANGNQSFVITSNVESLKQCQEYCRAAIEEIEAMRLRVEPDARRIQELLGNIPDYLVAAETEVEIKGRL